MHLARLWDSSRRDDGGYSLEALTNDSKVVPTNQSSIDDFNIGKISMKSIFGKKKVKKDGSEGKLVTIAPVEVLQREERITWICYSALDSINTLKLFQSLKKKLEAMQWLLNGDKKGNMFDFYEKYWRPFGFLLVKMESEGMLVDRAHLSMIEEVAKTEQQKAVDRFRKWASEYCPDAKYMNVGSDTQIRQLLFGGTHDRYFRDLVYVKLAFVFMYIDFFFVFMVFLYFDLYLCNRSFCFLALSLNIVFELLMHILFELNFCVPIFMA